MPGFNALEKVKLKLTAFLQPKNTNSVWLPRPVQRSMSSITLNRYACCECH